MITIYSIAQNRFDTYLAMRESLREQGAERMRFVGNVVMCYRLRSAASTESSREERLECSKQSL